MKMFLCSISVLMFSACCLVGAKCEDNRTGLNLRLLDFITRKDLLYGTSKIYNADSIKLFSLSGTDTVNHYCVPCISYSAGYDSVLCVNINVVNNAPVFLQLSDSDIDTLQLLYSVNDGGRCCGDTKHIYRLRYNQDEVDPDQGLLYKK